MSEMVEGVASAILKAIKGTGDEYVPGKILDMNMLARAAISAMRELTEDMITAGYMNTSQGTYREDVANAWNAMIDEALKDIPTSDVRAG